MASSLERRVHQLERKAHSDQTYSQFDSVVAVPYDLSPEEERDYLLTHGIRPGDKLFCYETES